MSYGMNIDVNLKFENKTHLNKEQVNGIGDNCVDISISYKPVNDICIVLSPQDKDLGTINLKAKDSNIIDVSTTEAFVDLGLPSGTLWAKENINENNGFQAQFYKWANMRYNDIDECVLRNYDGECNLKDVDDVANNKFGPLSHVPSLDDFAELKHNTISIPDEKGVTFISKINGNRITLPFKGYKSYNQDKNILEKYGYYWTDTKQQYEHMGYCVVFDGLNAFVDLFDMRDKLLVRPVLKKNINKLNHEYHCL